MKYIVVNNNDITVETGVFKNIAVDLFGDNYIDYIDVVFDSTFYRMWMLDNSCSVTNLRFNYKISRILGKDIYGPVIFCIPKSMPLEDKVTEDGLRDDEIFTITNALKGVN